jgi:hypothetical protein
MVFQRHFLYHMFYINAKTYNFAMPWFRIFSCVGETAGGIGSGGTREAYARHCTGKSWEPQHDPVRAVCV